MEKFIAALMQLLQGLTTSVQQLQQNQQDQQNQHQQNASQARDKHIDFMSHHPPTFSHSVDTLDFDD
jgi:membrane protease subunit (stomatin/prohibitin family)